MAKKRHIAKAFSWRIIGTLDTFIISYIFIGNVYLGATLSITDFFFKFLAYYYHERLWFLSNIRSAKKRHFLKTFTWRFIAVLITLISAYLITGNSIVGFKIGVFETISKMIVYYLHEKIWYKSNYGLEDKKC